MPDTFGLLELPVPVPADPRTEAVGDPLLDVLASFFKAVLNHDVGDAWASVYPYRGQKSAAPASLPVMFTETHDPDEAAFTSSRTPCLFVYRPDQPEPQRLRLSQSWEIIRGPVVLLLVPPPPTQDKQKLRTKIRNAIDKSIRAALRQGRHIAWKVPGDTYYDAQTYGSVLLPHTGLHSLPLFGGMRRQQVTIEDEDGNPGTPFPALLGTLLVDERWEPGEERSFPISHVQGAITIGSPALAIHSYEFRTTLTSIAPSSGPAAGGTAITLKGQQFWENVDVGALSLKIGDVACTELVLVDETTITAKTGAHAAGPASDVVLTLPNGSTASLGAAFTYV